MKNVTSIKVFGKCGVSRVNGNISFEQKYKFYLAFENCLCEDYITEKVYDWYTKDIILVVRGGANYSEHLPEGTYVNAADFRTPENLADFSNTLGSDEERYIEYLRRKDNYKVITEQENVQTAFCALCWRLNNNERFRKSHTNISSWWFGSCRSGNV
ncbi:alpha-(1,3)-fucosyltransferase C-like [Mya arenaria]|uniref:alpha-(1,3)-fucosyltransferase C-like n=1 Tax=Mya arenaria TaxID=6604 RepID=UPI0022E20955|nr:alpha-(1,3)-fucosyltransferase C-like [Mya arenaria]